MSEDERESNKVEVQVPAEVSSGTGLKYRFVNNSAREVLTGSDFGLDFEGTGGWESMNLGMIFTAEGIIVAPGTSREFIARLPDDLPVGSYRLRKGFRWSPTHGGPPPFATVATFRVTEP